MIRSKPATHESRQRFVITDESEAAACGGDAYRLAESEKRAARFERALRKIAERECQQSREGTPCLTSSYGLACYLAAIARRALARTEVKR